MNWSDFTDKFWTIAIWAFFIILFIIGRIFPESYDGLDSVFKGFWMPY